MVNIIVLYNMLSSSGQSMFYVTGLDKELEVQAVLTFEKIILKIFPSCQSIIKTIQHQMHSIFVQTQFNAYFN